MVFFCVWQSAEGDAVTSRLENCFRIDRGAMPNRSQADSSQQHNRVCACRRFCEILGSCYRSVVALSASTFRRHPECGRGEVHVAGVQSSACCEHACGAEPAAFIHVATINRSNFLSRLPSGPEVIFVDHCSPDAAATRLRSCAFRFGTFVSRPD